MELKKLSTIFLRLAIIGFGVLVLLFSIFLLPQAVQEAARSYSVPVYVSAAIGIYAAAIPFYIALYQGMRLLNLIDKNKAFSKKSVNSFKVIKIAGIVMSIFFAGALPLFYAVAQTEDAPGIMLIGLTFAGIPFVIGVFAAVMQRLIQNAVDIKSENDLTV